MLAKVEVAHYITEQLVIEDIPFNATIADASKDLIADTTAANVEAQKAAVDALLDNINASIDYTSTIGETWQGTEDNDAFSGVIDQRGGWHHAGSHRLCGRRRGQRQDRRARAR